MSAVPTRDVVKGLLIKALLDRITRGEVAVRASTPGARPRARRRERETPARPRRAVPALVLLGVGALTMLVFESPVTRVIGVVALFAFVVAGTFAIADPRWLAAAPELGEQERKRG